jgi:hypothetical protein
MTMYTQQVPSVPWRFARLQLLDIEDDEACHHVYHSPGVDNTIHVLAVDFTPQLQAVHVVKC